MKLVRGIVVGAIAGVLLVGCAPGAPQETSPPEASGAPSAESTPTTEPDGPTALPADCAALVAQADPAQFSAAPLNDPAFVPWGPSGAVTPSTPAADADPRQTMAAIRELACLWADPASDITHIAIEVGHLGEEDASTVFTTLAADGYACDEVLGGQRCSLTAPNSQFPVDDTFVYFSRDDVILLIDETNMPTDPALLDDLVAVIWG